MPFTPVDASVQFLPASGKLYVDDLVDPSGEPITVLDIDLGFIFKGHLELPGWLSGKGVVRLFADELGGPFDAEIGHDNVHITGATTPEDPGIMKYKWEIRVQKPTLPDQSKIYRFGVAFLFLTPGRGHTDIGAFYDLGTYMVV